MVATDPSLAADIAPVPVPAAVIATVSAVAGAAVAAAVDPDVPANPSSQV